MAQIYKRNDKWAYRVWIDSKHSKSKGGFKRKIDAQNAAYEIEVAKNNNLLTNNQNISFYELFKKWIETYKIGRLDDRTEFKYLKVSALIKETFNDTPIKDISTIDYQRMLDQYAQNHVKSTTSRLNSYIKKCLGFAINEGITTKDFTFGAIITGKKSKDSSLKFLELNEINQLKQLCLDEWSLKSITKLQILSGLLTGMRYGEVCGLTWQDIDFENNSIDINKAYDYINKTGFKLTKTTSSIRKIDIPPTLTHQLEKLQIEQNDYFQNHKLKNDEHLVFINNRQELPTSSAVNKALKQLLRRINSNNSIPFHGLRHSHASFLLAKGVKIDYVSERLGHANVSITYNIYAHLLQESRETENKKAIELLERI